MVDNVVCDAGPALGRALKAAKAERNSRFSETAVLTRLVEEQLVQREKDQKAIKALEAELRRIRTEKEEQVRRAGARAAGLEAELRKVRAEFRDQVLRDHRARLKALERDVQKLRTRYERFFTSRSWRITAPLRKIRRALFG